MFINCRHCYLFLLFYSESYFVFSNYNFIIASWLYSFFSSVQTIASHTLFRVGLLVIIVFWACLDRAKFVFPLHLWQTLAGFTGLSWALQYFRTGNTLLQDLLAFKISTEKSSIILMGCLFYVTFVFLLQVSILFLFVYI